MDKVTLCPFSPNIAKFQNQNLTGHVVDRNGCIKLDNRSGKIVVTGDERRDSSRKIGMTIKPT